MIIDQRNEAAVTTKEAFQAIGLKWEGTFAEAGAGGIRAVHRLMQERLSEIPHALHTDTLLGLSYHAVPGGDGFIHYAVVEVGRIDEVPEGWLRYPFPHYPMPLVLIGKSRASISPITISMPGSKNKVTRNITRII